MAVTQPNLVHSPHPLTAVGRQVIYEAPRRNETLGGYLRRLQIEVDRAPMAVHVNGRPVVDWRRYRLRRGDYVEVRAVVAGGGGAGKVLRSVALIALAVMAAPLAEALTVGEFAALGGISTMAVQAGIVIGGSLLINALLPPPMPDIAGFGGRGDASISQNYALSGARNRARTYAPMPLVIGARRMIPDAGGNPFTEFSGQDQYLYQVYHFGLQPDLQLTDLRIGNTPIANYQGVELSYAGADGVLPAAFGNVSTDVGREVKNSDGWVVRQLERDTIAIGMDLQGVAYYANDQGGMETRNVDVQVQYRQLPDGAWQAYGGDAYGKYRLSGSSITPVRQTLLQRLPQGQYEIRVHKLSGDISSSRERNDFALAGLRAYRQDATSYASQRRVGLKIKASSQLNGAVDELSAMAVASCPVWTGSAWVTQPTMNPAWWYLWFARGAFDAQGRRMYGAGLPDARIDIEAIKAWGAWCDAKKLSIGLVLDRAYSIADVLAMIARCGRARYTWQTGRLGVIWDAAELPVVAVFGPANIRSGSFKIDYTNEQTADEVVVNFSNPDKGYDLDQVRVAVPGVISPTNPVTLDFIGCCDADMAGREANLIAASQLYHRRRVSWETDFEGLVAARGDVVLLSHDLANWSYSGRMLGGDRQQLRLDRAVPLGANGWVGVRYPDGRYATYRVKPGSGDSDTLQLRDLIPASDAGGPLPVPDESPDSVPYDWMWFYDNGAQPGRRVKIVDVKPASDGVKFIAIDDNPAYYAAETGSYDTSAGSPTLPAALGFLRLSESSRLTGDGRRVAVVTAVWPPLRGAINYQLKYRRAGGSWAAVVVPDTSYSWDVDPQDLEVSVFAVLTDGTLSAPAVSSLTVQGHAVPPPVATAFQAIGELMQITLRWAYPDRRDLRGVQIDASLDGNTWTRLVELAYPTITWTHLGLSVGATLYYQLRLVDTWGNVGAPVAASATVVKDVNRLLDALQGSIDKGQLADSLRQPIEKLPDMQLQLQDLSKLTAGALGQASDAGSLASTALNAAMQLVQATDWMDNDGKTRFARVDQTIKTIQEDGRQEALARTELVARLDQAQAKLTEELQVLASADAANARATEQLSSKTDTAVAGLTSQLETNATAASATASKLDTYAAQTDKSLAGISSKIQANTDAQAATAGKLDAYAAQTDKSLAGINSKIQANTDAQAATAGKLDAYAAQTDKSLAGINSQIQANTDAQAATAGKLDAYAAQTDKSLAGISSKIQANTDAQAATAGKLDAYAAQTDKSLAGISSKIQANTDAQAATAGKLDAYAAQTDKSLAGINSQIQANADAQSATARKLDTYQAQTAEQIAGVRRDMTAATGPDSALVRDMQQRIAQSQSDAVASANSLTEQRTGPNSALSQSIQQLDSRVQGSETTIRQQAQTIDGLRGQWSLKISRAVNGVQLVSGIGLNSGPEGSAFAVVADKFYYALPDGSSITPVFTLGTVNGRPAAGLAGDLFLDGGLVGRRVIASESIDAGQINSRGLTIRDAAGNVVVSMDGMSAGYIRGKLNVGQIDTEGLRITRNGSTVVDATGMDGAYIRNLMVDTVQIKGEAVTKADTRTISANGWVDYVDYSFSFYCSDAGTLLCFAEAPSPFTAASLYARDRSVALSSMSGLIVLSVAAGEVVSLGCRGSIRANAYASLRYGCVLFRR